MQGKKSAVGSLPDSINFDYGSSSSDMNIEQQICWNNLRNTAESRLSEYRISASSSDNSCNGIANHEGRNLGRWNVGESSSSNPQNLVGHDEQLPHRGWSPSPNASVGPGLRLDELQYEPTDLVSPSGVNLNISSNQIVTGPTFVRGSSSGSASQNLDMNDGHYHRVVDVNCPNSSKPLGLEGNSHPSASTASDVFASSSGSGGFVFEDDDSRAGCSSLDGRRLSCKRKTLEGNAGQSSSSGSFFPRAEGSVWQTIPPPRYDTGRNMSIAPTPESSSNVSLPEQINPRLGLGMGGGVPGDSIHPLNVPGGLGSSRRNYRLRMNPSSQQDSMPNNSFSPAPTNVTGHPDIPSVHQPLRFVPVNPPLDLMPPIQSDSSIPQNHAAMLRAPAFRRNLQSHRWNQLRPGSSPNVALSGERGIALPDESSSRNLPRNIGEHPMFAPQVEARISAQHPTNWSLSSGGVGISRNTGSSSHAGSSAGSQSASGSSWYSQRNTQSQYSRRLSEYVCRSLSTTGSETIGPSSQNSQHRSVPGSSQDVVLPSNVGSQGYSVPRSRSALWMERQGDGASGIPYLRALAAAGDGRSRLVSEIRNALDIIRRGEGLRFEDVMIFDPSVLYGMADIHDQHRDMRLDVDNMSYEELLALEERIGNVCTGLSEETILKCMKQSKHVHTMSEEQTDTEPCCVCQEVYKDGEDMGILDCGHDFHTECIKKWLGQKNLCPICKTTALAT